MVANFERQTVASNPEIQAVIGWLLSQNLPPLPVAPQQKPREYPKVVKADRRQQIWEHCPLDYELQPIPLFTGKNPSFLDRQSVPHLINHRQYQSSLPSGSDLRKWFANPTNGIGTLGGHGGVVWLDFDVKQFGSEVECSRAVKSWGESHPELKGTFTERTHSNGWRIGIKVRQKPDFTNFTLFPSGDHVGEALGAGRFTVLAPTIGPSGNAYRSINRTHLVEVESLKAIDIYSSGKSKPLSQHFQRPQPSLSVMPGSIPLEMLLTDRTRAIFSGDNPTGDRSEALTILIREACGWENWARDNNVAIRDNAEVLAYAAGGALGIDSERIGRILKTIDAASCHPAAAYNGSESSCWLKVRRLDKATFEAKCPTHIKDAITYESKSQRERISNVVPHLASNQTGGNGNPPQSSENVPYALVKELVFSGMTQAQLSGALIELSTSTGYQLGGLKNLAKEIEAELASGSTQADDTKETNKLLEYREQTLDLRRVFPQALANYLLTKADSDRLDPAFVYQFLWSAIGLSLGAHIGIRGKKGVTGDDWVEFPIFYNVVIAPPSSGKSQTMRAVLGPIKDKQTRERSEYKKAQKYLEGLKEKWGKKSVDEKERLKHSDQNPDVYVEQMPQQPKVQLIEAGTPEGAFKRMSELPAMSGCVLAFDELIRILSLDQYKNQGGDSRQILMEAWAHPFSTEFVRSDDNDTPSLNKICISITGGIQPSKAKNLLSDPDDGDGLLSRFLIAQTKTPDNFAVWSDTQVDINRALCDLYKSLEKLHYDLRKRVYGDDYIQSIVDGKQVILQFDAAAEERWHRWWEHVRSQQRNFEHENPALSGYLGKILSQTLRLALGLHCIELMYSDKADPLVVELETLERAIYASKFHIGQFRLLQANNDDTSNLSGQLAKIHQYAQRKGQPVSASQVQMTVFRRSERKPTLAQLREWFKQLAEAGVATLVGEGKDLKIQVVIIMTSYDKKYDKRLTPETTIKQGTQDLLEKKYDNYDKNDSCVNAPVVDSESSTNGICHNCHNSPDDVPSPPSAEPDVGADDLSENLSYRVINYDNLYDSQTAWANEGVATDGSSSEPVIIYDSPEGTDTLDNKPSVPSGTGFAATTDSTAAESASAPTQLQSPSAATTVAAAPTELKAGDVVGHSDPYMAAYAYQGTVEEVAGDNILVRWAERRGKPNELETYHTSELRRPE